MTQLAQGFVPRSEKATSLSQTPLTSLIHDIFFEPPRVSIRIEEDFTQEVRIFVDLA